MGRRPMICGRERRDRRSYRKCADKIDSHYGTTRQGSGGASNQTITRGLLLLLDESMIGIGVRLDFRL
ncbi:hypothetical protein LINGRAPRIM_LOCUS2849 [Linum grandiflorum]